MARKGATESDPPVVPGKMEIATFITTSQSDAEAGLSLIAELTIKTPAEREFAANALKEFATRHDTADAKRKAWVGPLKAVTADIDATFRPLLQVYKRGEAILKDKIGRYDVAQAQARRTALEAAAKASAAGHEAQAAKAIAKAEAYVAAPTPGNTSTLYWTGEVLDAALVPREYCTPDLAMLEAVTKALGADPKIPGWRAFEAAAVKTSRRG